MENLVEYVKRKKDSLPPKTLWIFVTGINFLFHEQMQEDCKAKKCKVPLITLKPTEKMNCSNLVEETLEKVSSTLKVLRERANAALDPESSFVVFPLIPLAIIDQSLFNHAQLHQMSKGSFKTYIALSHDIIHFNEIFKKVSDKFCKDILNAFLNLNVEEEFISEHLKNKENQIDIIDKQIDFEQNLKYFNIWVNMFKRNVFTALGKVDSLEANHSSQIYSNLLFLEEEKSKKYLEAENKSQIDEPNKNQVEPSSIHDKNSKKPEILITSEGLENSSNEHSEMISNETSTLSEVQQSFDSIPSQDMVKDEGIKATLLDTDNKTYQVSAELSEVDILATANLDKVCESEHNLPTSISNKPDLNTSMEEKKLLRIETDIDAQQNKDQRDKNKESGSIEKNKTSDFSLSHMDQVSKSFTESDQCNDSPVDKCVAATSLTDQELMGSSEDKECKNSESLQKNSELKVEDKASKGCLSPNECSNDQSKEIVESTQDCITKALSEKCAVEDDEQQSSKLDEESLLEKNPSFSTIKDINEDEQKNKVEESSRLELTDAHINEKDLPESENLNSGSAPSNLPATISQDNIALESSEKQKESNATTLSDEVKPDERNLTWLNTSDCKQFFEMFSSSTTKKHFEHIYIFSNKNPVINEVEKLLKYTFIKFDSSTCTSTSLDNLLDKIKPPKPNSICVIIFDISYITTIFDSPKDCSRYNCSKILERAVLKNYPNEILQDTREFISKMIDFLIDFVNTLSLTLPTLIMPLEPRRIYAEYCVSRETHMTNHEMVSNEGLIVYGQIYKWISSLGHFLQEWNRVIAKNECYLDPSIINKYMNSQGNVFPINKYDKIYLQHWNEIEKWREFIINILLILNVKKFEDVISFLDGKLVVGTEETVEGSNMESKQRVDGKQSK